MQLHYLQASITHINRSRTLRGESLLPVIHKLKQNVGPFTETTAIINKRPLVEFSYDEVGKYFRRFTGEKITTVLDLAQLEDTIFHRRVALDTAFFHCSKLVCKL